MNFLQTHKKWIIIGLLGLSVVMMAFTGRDGYRQGPVRSAFGAVITGGQQVLSGIGDWFSDRWNFLTTMNDLHRENQQLIAENERLEMQLAQLLHLLEENQALSELVYLHRQYDDYAVLAAGVISHNPSNWASNFIINQGANSGIAVDMAVLAPGGFAGRVSSVGFGYANVSPLIEDGVAISAQNRRSGYTGVVRGDISLSSYGLLRMNYIAAYADFNVGDEVISSHLSSIFPPGILIGNVVEVGQTMGGMRYALVEPAVDFSRITHVLVITDTFE